jgi:Phosphotransferase enzyme family
VIGQCREFLLDNVARWGLPNAGEWNFLFHNNYHPHCSNLNLMWFHNGGQFPRVVTKVFRDDLLPKREFENLEHVYACVPALVPRPLHFGLLGGWWTFWMEGVPGLRFSTSHGYRPAILRSLVQAVASMHDAVRNRGDRLDHDRYRRAVLEPLQTVVQFGASPSVRRGCADVAARSSADWLNSLPVIRQHGDLFSSNIISHRGRWWVLDWESFGTIDLPFYDLFTLLLSLLRTGGQTPEHWDSSLVKQVPSLIESYARALGLSTADASQLLPLTLVNWFHLQWCDGRKEFTERMYEAIQHYFEHPDTWNRALLPIAPSSGSR